MSNRLTKEQILLLNSLMYMTEDEPFIEIHNAINKCEGKTVGEIIQSINVSKIADDYVCGAYMTGEEWKKMIQAVQADEQLMNMQIIATQQDDKGGCNTLFVDSSTNEAVVVFKGTGGGEWLDNFQGGTFTDRPDGVSTLQQESALEWYQSLDLSSYDSITVTGHSKGGNKAKYITVQDSSVDRCISFDGQGFSDEFMEKYKEEIADCQYKIENHNAESDYVNFLLNDIGDTYYYEGQEIGKFGFVENHSPNTLMKVEDGNVSMIPRSQNENIIILDEFLNSYLRFLSTEEKKKALDLVGNIVQGIFSNPPMSVNDMLKIILKPENIEITSNLLAYLLKYNQTNPEIRSALEFIANEFEISIPLRFIMEIFSSDFCLDVLDFGMLNSISFIGGIVPDWIVNKLRDYLKNKYGIEVTNDQVRQLCKVLGRVVDKMDEIQINDNGKDIKITNYDHNFEINLVALRQVEATFGTYVKQMKDLSDTIGQVKLSESMGIAYLNRAIQVAATQVDLLAATLENMERSLNGIIENYNNTENKILNNCQ